MNLKRLPIFTAALLAVSALAPSASSQGRALNDDGTPAYTVKSNGSPGTNAPGILSTLFASNNGFAGNMIDMTPTYDMELTGIDVNTDSVGFTVSAEIWWRPGTSVGFEDSASGWNYLGNFFSKDGATAGLDNPTFVDLTGNGVTFEAGETYGLYVDLISFSNGVGIFYTDGGPVTYSNAELTVVTNCGKANGGFSANTFYPRQMNTNLYYDFHAFELSTTGTPGGLMTFDVNGATPSGPVVYVHANGLGSHSGINPYTGNIVTTGLAFAGFTVGATVNADPTGVFSLPANVPSAAIGLIHVQALDGLTDLLSNVISL